MLYVYFEHGVVELEFALLESHSSTPLTAKGVDIVGANESGGLGGDIEMSFRS